MASRSAVMISGERNANCASSFLRSAGASCEAAALRWMTRPARSSSPAGSAIPATTALTAAASTGLMPRTSSREATALCNRHGTKAAPATQTKTIAAMAGETSPNNTNADSASPAASRMMAECLKRSGQGWNIEEEASVAIGPAVSSGGWSGAGIAVLARITAVALRLDFGRRHQLAQAFQPRAQDKLPKRQQDYRYDERRDIIEQAEQQHPGEQIFLVHLPEADQHCGVEHAEAARRMAGEAEQRRRDENDGDDDEAEIRLVRHQHVHRQRAKAEIDNA